MYETYFHNLDTGLNEVKILDRIPRIGETIAFRPSGSFFLIKGITQHSFEPDCLPPQYPIEIYATEIQQSTWIKSLREKL